MEERKVFKSIHIDLEKDIYELNGECISETTSELNLYFENGKWSLQITKEDCYASEVTK